MSDNSQKTQKDVLEQIKSLKTVDDIRAFELDNQQLIINGTTAVKIEFDDKWYAIIGAHYFMPITALPKSETRPGVTHPKYTNYRVMKRVVGIQWSKIAERRKAQPGTPAPTVEIYHLIALLPDGTTTTIDTRLSRDQVPMRLGPDISQKVLSGKGLAGNVGGIDQEISCIGYWQVVFSNKGQTHETNYVGLSAIFIALQMERMKPVIVAGYHLEAADRGQRPVFVQNPKQRLKMAASMQYFPYTVVREATEVEYLAEKAAGDTKVKEEMAKQEMISQEIAGQGGY